MRRNIAITLGLISLFIVSGCTTRQADVTAVSNKNIKLDGVNLEKLDGRTIRGVDGRWIILFIPTDTAPQIQYSLDDALNKASGDLMLDGVISTRSWWFLIGREELIIEGEVVNTTSFKE